MHSRMHSRVDSDQIKSNAVLATLNDFKEHLQTSRNNHNSKLIDDGIKITDWFFSAKHPTALQIILNQDPGTRHILLRSILDL